MRRIWPRFSPFRVLGVIRPLLLLIAVGASGIIVACQGPEPFRLDVTLPDTGGTAAAGNPGTGGKVGTGGVTVATGGRATGGTAVATGGATGGVTVATGGRATGGITVATGGRVSNTGGMHLGGSSGSGGMGGTGSGGIPGGCTATTEKVIVSLKAGAQSGGTNALSFSVLNAGDADIKLASLKLRYYFKPASTAAPSAFIYEIDNITGNNKAVVTSSVGATTPAPTTSTGADDYLELSFAATAPPLSPASSFLMDGRLHDKAYAVGFTPTMDYSYVLSTTYVKAPKVVASLTTATGSCVLAGIPPS